MSDKNEADRACSEAAIEALERAFVLGDLRDSLSQARAILAYLQGVCFIEDESPGPHAMYGYGLILTLVDILLQQVAGHAEPKSPRGTTEPDNLAVVGE